MNKNIIELLKTGTQEELDAHKAGLLDYVERKLIENNIYSENLDGRLFLLTAKNSTLTSKGYIYNSQPKVFVKELGCSLSTFYRILQKFRHNNFRFFVETQRGGKARIQFIWAWTGDEV